MTILFCSVVGFLLIVSYLVLYLAVERIIFSEFDRRLLQTAFTLSDDLARYAASPNDIAEVGIPGEIFEVFDEQGKTIALSESLHERPLQIQLKSRDDLPQPLTLSLPEQGKMRVVSVPVRSATVTRLDHWGVLVNSSGATLTVCAFRVETISDSPSPPKRAQPRPLTDCVSTTGDSGWRNIVMPVSGSGTFTASFDAKPSMAMDASMGFSQGEPVHSAGFPAMVVFRSSGVIRSRNGAGGSEIKYRKGRTYRFRWVVDVGARTYSVFVTPPKGVEQPLVSNISFRKSRDWTLVVARSTKEADAALARLQRLIVILLASNLILVVLVAALYVRSSLRPLAELTSSVSLLAQRFGTPASFGSTPLQRLEVPNSKDEPGRLAEAFNQLTATLNDTLRQLRRFVSDASHELRTPLAILRGEAELLLRKPRSVEEYHQAVAIIHTELKHLGDIVEGLFTLSMADAGQLRIANEPVYLNELLDEVCARMKHRAQLKSIEIKRGYSEEVLAFGDEGLLRGLFSIFLDNALKYSPSHTLIRVDVRGTVDTAVVSFEDQGIGISEAHMPHIFERFYRVPAADAEDTQGSGLGLAIARAIAEAHGGTIGCSSTPGQGSVFAVRLSRNLLPMDGTDVDVLEPSTLRESSGPAEL
jgi:signal transduction histidine kinase